MDNVTQLKLAPENTRASDFVLAAFDEKVAKMRSYVEEHPDCGFVLATYCRLSHGAIATGIDYFMNDPMDAYVLPDFLKARMIYMRDRND